MPDVDRVVSPARCERIVLVPVWRYATPAYRATSGVRAPGDSHECRYVNAAGNRHVRGRHGARLRRAHGRALRRVHPARPRWSHLRSILDHRGTPLIRTGRPAPRHPGPGAGRRPGTRACARDGDALGMSAHGAASDPSAAIIALSIEHHDRVAPRRLRHRLAARRRRNGRGVSRARYEAETRSRHQGAARQRRRRRRAAGALPA